MADASPGPSAAQPLPAQLSLSSTTLYLTNLPHNWTTIDLSSSLLFTCQPVSTFQPTPTTAFILFTSHTAAQHAKRTLAAASPVQAVWATEVEDGRDVRVTMVEAGQKILRADVLKASGMKESEVVDTATDSLLLQSADVRSLLLAVNRLQCVSAGYRFSSVERQRSMAVKRKSSSFLAELGERNNKSTNGGLTSSVASSPPATLTPARLSSPPPAPASSPPSLPQQAMYPYPPSLPPSTPPTLMQLPIPPPPMPPPFPMPPGIMPTAFLPLPPPPMPPPMPPPSLTYQPHDTAAAPMLVEQSESAGSSRAGEQERRSNGEWRRDDSPSDSKSSTWSSRHWQADDNGREDAYKQQQFDDWRDRDRGDSRWRQPSPQTPPQKEAGVEWDSDRDRSREYQARERYAYSNRDERGAAEPRERERERERRWSERDESWTSDDRRTWRGERDDEQYRGDERAKRWEREERHERHERRDDSRADSERDWRRERRDDTKDERHSQSTLEQQPHRSNSTTKQPHIANQPPTDGQHTRDSRETERYRERDRENDSSNGSHSASKRYRSDERERENSRSNVEGRERHSVSRRDNEEETRRGREEGRLVTANGGDETAETHPPHTAAVSRPTSSSTAEERKDKERGAERWRPPPDDSDTRHPTTVPPPSHRPRTEAGQPSNRHAGQPSGPAKRRTSEERKPDGSSVLRIGF